MKHTTGPWTYDPNSGWINAEKCCHRGSMHVADIRGWGHLTGGGIAHALPPKDAKEIQDANARLICAAPDLLALAEIVVLEIECYCTDHVSVHGPCAYHAAKAAIAKVTG